MPALDNYEDIIGGRLPGPMPLGCRREMRACHGEPNPSVQPDRKIRGYSMGSADAGCRRITYNPERLRALPTNS